MPLLCFDGDAAGQKAAIRAAIRALPMLAPGRSLCFATLPPGQDPDDLVRGGGRDAAEAVFKASAPLVDLLWRHERDAAPLDTPEARAGLRRRLADHARTIADPDVRRQYEIEFNERFFQQFLRARSFKRGDAVRSFRTGAANAGKRDENAIERDREKARWIGRNGGMDRMLARSVLCGLLHHPEALVSHADAIACVALDATLESFRNVMLDAAFSVAALEPGRLASILTEAGLADAADDLQRTNVLAFSFLRGNAQTERALRDLGAAIEALATRPELDAALAAATARLNAAPDEAGFAEQLRLRAARDAADRSLAALAQGEDG